MARPPATRRMTSGRATNTPSAIASSGSAPSRRGEGQKPAEQDEASEHQARGRRQVAARGEKVRIPPKTAEIEQPEPEARGEVQDQAEGHGPGGQMGEGEPAHALFIHFQADQQPSARPSNRSGPVQNSPE